MMQKYGFSMTDKGTTAVPSDVGGFYLASDVDARIAEWLKMCDDHANSSEPVTSPASRAAFRAVASFIRGSLTD